MQIVGAEIPNAFYIMFYIVWILWIVFMGRAQKILKINL